MIEADRVAVNVEVTDEDWDDVDDIVTAPVAVTVAVSARVAVAVDVAAAVIVPAGNVTVAVPVKGRVSESVAGGSVTVTVLDDVDVSVDTSEMVSVGVGVAGRNTYVIFASSRAFFDVTFGRWETAGLETDPMRNTAFSKISSFPVLVEKRSMTLLSDNFALSSMPWTLIGRMWKSPHGCPPSHSACCIFWKFINIVART